MVVPQVKNNRSRAATCRLEPARSIRPADHRHSYARSYGCFSVAVALRPTASPAAAAGDRDGPFAPGFGGNDDGLRAATTADHHGAVALPRRSHVGDRLHGRVRPDGPDGIARIVNGAVIDADAVAWETCSEYAAESLHRRHVSRMEVGDGCAARDERRRAADMDRRLQCGPRHRTA